MHRSLRMLGILMDLQGGSSTLGKLAAKYECSSKTIQRDIASLTELNIPVTSAPGVHGGISLDPGWMLGPLNLNAAEIETLILALESAPHLPAAESALAKIRAASTPSRFDRVDDDPLRPSSRSNRSPSIPMPDGVQQIRNILSREMWCRLDYSSGSNPGWRLVLPQQLRILEGKWYLHAIDQRSRERRIFRVDRVRDIVPALAPADAAEIIQSAENQPGYQSDHYPEIVVDLNPAAVQFCRDHSHFHQHIEGHLLRFRCPPGEYQYVARELMRMGTDCRAIAPAALLETMRELVSDIARHIANE